MSDRLKDLESLAPKIGSLKVDPVARVYYELMSGGLAWTDELPALEKMNSNEFGVMRALWSFRSSLILGSPKEKYRFLWEESQRWFPSWPGFQPDRQSETWKSRFQELEAKGLAEWDALEDRFNVQTNPNSATLTVK